MSQQIRFLPGYPDSWQEQLEQNLANKNIENWAYILHDRDIDENGDPKPAHIHAIIILTQSLKVGTVANFFGVKPNYIQFIGRDDEDTNDNSKRKRADVGRALSYLTHRNAPRKYQYSDGDVIAKPGFDWKALRAESEKAMAEWQTLEKVYNGIEHGKIHEYDIFEHISMRTFIDKKVDIDRAFDYRLGVLKLSSDREISVIYICGEPGAGKTTLAKQLCAKRSYSYCLSGSSRDPLQDYRGQDVLILDDLRPDTFSLTDLLKLLDNHSSSSASARYRDRWLQVKMIIITTIQPLKEFFSCQPDRREPIQQLMRRCRTMITMTKEDMQIYQYNDAVEDYVHVTTAKNPVAEMHKDILADERDKSMLRDLCADLGVDCPFGPAPTN